MAETKSVWTDLWQRDMTLLYNLRFWSLTVLRLFLGALFTYHGFLRLFVPSNLQNSITYFGMVGIPYPSFALYIIGGIELAGGVLLFLGLLTRWSAFALMAMLAYAFFKVHLANGFLIGNNGYEFVLILFAALLAVFVNGAGHLSLGKMMKG